MFRKLYLYPVAERYYTTRRNRELSPTRESFYPGRYWTNYKH